MAASQLNRASEGRTERRPTLADVQDSGQLEADSDAVILLHREADLPENAYLTVAKNRHNRIGEASTLAIHDRSTLASLSMTHPKPYRRPGSLRCWASGFNDNSTQSNWQT